MSARSNRSKAFSSDIFHKTSCLTLEQLTAYAEDRLTAQERFEIERHLLDCELCSDAFEGFELIENKDRIKHQIEALNKEIHRTVTPRIIYTHNWRVYYSLAAVFVIAFVSILYILNREPAYDSLFAEYFKPYPNMVPLVRGEEPAGLLESAMVEYENENYKECLIILKNLLNSKPDNDTANFYAGISSLCLNDPASAIPYLQKVADDKKSDLIDQATWYLGLTYLTEKNIEAAKMSFNMLCLKEGNFKQKSIEIMNRMK